MNFQNLYVVTVFCFWYVAYVLVAVGSVLIISWEQTSEIIRK